jgi:hypothetical protein
MKMNKISYIECLVYTWLFDLEFGVDRFHSITISIYTLALESDNKLHFSMHIIRSTLYSDCL